MVLARCSAHGCLGKLFGLGLDLLVPKHYTGCGAEQIGYLDRCTPVGDLMVSCQFGMYSAKVVKWSM